MMWLGVRRVMVEPVVMLPFVGAETREGKACVWEKERGG